MALGRGSGLYRDGTTRFWPGERMGTTFYHAPAWFFGGKRRMSSLPPFSLSLLKNQLVSACDSEPVQLAVVTDENGFLAAEQLV